MRRRTAFLIAAVWLAALLCVAGCGGDKDQETTNRTKAPPESEVGAPVYPGADFESKGAVPGSYMYTTTDSSAEVVNWYRRELGRKIVTETNEAAEAITGNAINYVDDDDVSIWITIMPGMDELPTTIDIFVTTPVQ